MIQEAGRSLGNICPPVFENVTDVPNNEVSVFSGQLLNASPALKKLCLLGSEGEGLPHGSPKSIDSVAKSIAEDPMGKQVVWHSPYKKSPRGSGAEIFFFLKKKKACRSFLVNESRYWHCGQSREEDGREPWLKGLKEERITRSSRFNKRKYFQAESSTTEAGFKNEENAR